MHFTIVRFYLMLCMLFFWETTVQLNSMLNSKFHVNVMTHGLCIGLVCMNNLCTANIMLSIQFSEYAWQRCIVKYKH